MLTALILVGLVAAVGIPVFLSGTEEGEDAGDAPDTGGDPQDPQDPETGETGEDPVTSGILELLGPAPEDAGPDGGTGAQDAAAPLMLDSGMLVSLPQPGLPDGAEPADPGALPSPAPDPAEVTEGPGDLIGGILRPVDPDTPDLPGPDLPGLVPLSPGDPDAPDLPGPDLPGLVPIGPTDPDAPETPPPGLAESGVLSPAAGGAQDPAPLSARGAPVDMADFIPGRDVLEVTLLSRLDPDAVALEVQPSADGQDGIVRVNAQVIAILRGAPGAGAEDVLLRLQDPA